MKRLAILALFVGMSALPRAGVSAAQAQMDQAGSNQAGKSGPGASQTGTTSTHRGRTHRHRRSASSARRTQGTITPGARLGSSATRANQRAADQRLLLQQQARSAHEAKVNDQVVQQAMEQRQKVQDEVRIQDAPEAPPTGATGSVAPVDSSGRIQDAPGPAQTSPGLPPTAMPASPSSGMPGETTQQQTGQQPGSYPAQPSPQAVPVQPQR